MKKILGKATVLLVVLGIILPSTGSGIGFSSAEARNSGAMTVFSEKFILAAVTGTTLSNPQNSLVLSASTSGVLFYVKNFGTRSIHTFDIAQQALGAVTLRYCESGFVSNLATDTCVDGSTSILVAIRNGTFRVSLVTPIGPGNSLEVKQDSRRTTQNTISISVSPQ